MNRPSAVTLAAVFSAIVWVLSAGPAGAQDAASTGPALLEACGVSAPEAPPDGQPWGAEVPAQRAEAVADGQRDSVDPASPHPVPEDFVALASVPVVSETGDTLGWVALLGRRSEPDFDLWAQWIAGEPIAWSESTTVVAQIGWQPSRGHGRAGSMVHLARPRSSSGRSTPAARPRVPAPGTGGTAGGPGGAGCRSGGGLGAKTVGYALMPSPSGRNIAIVNPYSVLGFIELEE